VISRLQLRSAIHLATLLTLVLLSASFAAPQRAADAKADDKQEAKKPEDSSAAATNQPAASFRSRSDLVLLPVVVRDNKGHYVTGLSQDAFHLEENGKPQPITYFEAIQAPVPIAPSHVEDHVYSNLLFDRGSQQQLSIVVLDLLNTSPLQRTDGKDQLVKFLSRSLAPNRQVAVVCLTSKGLKLVQSPSADAKLLAGALSQTPSGPETIIGHWNSAELTIRELRDVAQAYAGVPGRKTLLFAAGYIPELATERAINDSSPLAMELRALWQSLIGANIAVYPFQIMAWSADPSGRGFARRTTDLLLRQFAVATGGNLCEESNGLSNCLAEAVEDSRSYYTLGFTVQPGDRKPGWRDLKVKVSAEHVDVRSRDGFYYGVLAPADSKSARDQEISALASAVPYTAVAMSVKVIPPAAAQPSASANKIAVEFLLTIPASSISVDPSQPNPLDLDVGAIALTRDSREAAEFLQPVHGNPSQEVHKAWARDGIRLREKLDLPPGFYDLRFFVRDNNSSQIGTIVFPLTVP
jgi:VWFA-related protein